MKQMSMCGYIELDRKFTDCAICGQEIPLDTGFALPMYEGKVNWHSPVGFPVCESCYVANQL